jgi:arylsulfatase A-like enzyme
MKIKTLFVFIIFYILWLYSEAQQTNMKFSKPNIIFILADDLGYGDLSCYGQTKFSTPNIDALAKEVMLFTQYYSGATVCAPSRSALMTSLHTVHTFVRGNKEVRPERQIPIPDTTYILPEFLKSEGYVTGAFGKWGLGYPNSEGDPLNLGFDVFFGYNCQRLEYHYYPYHLWNNNKWEFHELNGRQAIRKDNWKLVKYNAKQIPEYFLFDLDSDPSDTNNFSKVKQKN